MDFVLDLLEDHIKENNIGEEDFCFRSVRDESRAIGFRYAGRVFRAAMEKAGIQAGERKLVPHSLRYTYITQVRRELPVETVMKMVGHTSIAMTEYYNKREIDRTLKNLPGADAAVARLFS